MKTIYFNLTQKLNNSADIPLLAMRLVLAYGFFGPASMKISDVEAISEWFSSIGIPAPTLNAYLATYTELLGSIFLVLGFATRFISIPLIITMLVAINTVHWTNGFEAAENGFEIPLYYIVMLTTLFFTGPGRLSMDHLLKKMILKSTKTNI